MLAIKNLLQLCVHLLHVSPAPLNHTDPYFPNHKTLSKNNNNDQQKRQLLVDLWLLFLPVTAMATSTIEILGGISSVFLIRGMEAIQYNAVQSYTMKAVDLYKLHILDPGVGVVPARKRRVAGSEHEA